MLTPKESGKRGIAPLFPETIANSALLESGYSSTGAVATDCTIALGFKPTAATTAPLIDMDGHYLLTIQKQGSTVRIWKQGVELDNYAGAVGSTYAEFLSNVLTAYSGSDKGYSSRLVVAPGLVLDYADFWECSDFVTGLWVPKDISGIDLTTPAWSSATWESGDRRSYITPTASNIFDADGMNNLDFLINGVNDSGVTFVGDGVAVAGHYIAFEFDSPAIVTNAKLTSTNSSQGRGTWKWQGSNDGTNWTDLGSSFALELNASHGAFNGSNTPYTHYRMLGVSDSLNNNENLWEMELLTSRQSTGVLLDFSNALDLGADSSGNGNDWTLTGTQSDDTPTDNLTTRAWDDPTILKSSTVVDVVLREGTGGDATFGVTPTSSGTDSSAVTNINDDNTATYWRGKGWTIEFDFGEERTFDSVGVYAISSTAVAPNEFYVDYWDGSAWQEAFYHAYQGSGMWPSGNMWNTYSFTQVSGTKARLRVIRNNSNQTENGSNDCEIGEFKLEGWGTPIVLPDMESGPDWVNLKNRDGAYSHQLFDTIGGALEVLHTDQTTARYTFADTLTAFNSDGYALGSTAGTNGSGDSFVDLCLKAGVDQGFEIVTWDGDDTHDRLIPHGLTNAPAFIVVKKTNTTSIWLTYHQALGQDKYLDLSGNAAAVNAAGIWNTVNATDFAISGNTWNAVGETYIAYLFTDSDIFKAFSYTGNGSTDGPFVNLGGRVLSLPFVKNSDAVGGWSNYDAARTPCNPINRYLRPDETGAEVVYGNGRFDFTSTGVKVTDTDGFINGSGNLIVGLAILESTKYSNAF